MKKKISILLILFIGLFSIFILYNQFFKQVENKEKKEFIPVREKVEINYEEYINNLKNTYHNQDVVAIIQIPNVLEEVVVQTDNNNYYLYHDAYHNETNIGATFLDYRNNLRESKKILIYSHSDPEGQLPFVKLTNYNKEEFLNNNPYIYIIDKEGKRTYEVFSSYIETKDFDYVNLESFGGLTYKEHLEKLKKKSFVSTEIELTEDSKVLVLQTCSFDERVNARTKYQIVVAKEV